MEHHLQPHQPKRSRVTSQSLVTQAPKYVSVVSEVCGRPGLLDLESSIGFVLRLIHTDCAKYYISLDTEKLSRSSFQHGGAGSPPLEKQGRACPLPRAVPMPMNFLKHLIDMLGVSAGRGIVWAKEEGSWRDLEIICEPKSVCVWGGGVDTPFCPPSLESVCVWGGKRTSRPSCSYAYVTLIACKAETALY